MCAQSKQRRCGRMIGSVMSERSRKNKKVNLDEMKQISRAEQSENKQRCLPVLHLTYHARPNRLVAQV